MSDFFLDETADRREENPFRAPDASLVPASITSSARPFRKALIGAAVGGGLGAAADLALWILLLTSAGDDEVGPLFVAFLLVFTVGVVVVGAIVGAAIGLLAGLMTLNIACMSARPNRR